MGILPLDSGVYCTSELDKRAIKVTAIFDSVRKVNDHLEKNEDQGLLCSHGGMHFIAKLKDLGRGMNLLTAKNLQNGQEIWHVERKNKSDGKYMVAKVTSVKTWKRNPEKVLVKYKRGLYEYGSMDETQLHLITDKNPNT